MFKYCEKVYENVENCIFKDIDGSREEHLRNDFLVESFCCLVRFSSVVELFIDFLTSGLSFVKSCWGLILWCSGGPLLYF